MNKLSHFDPLSVRINHLSDQHHFHSKNDCMTVRPMLAVEELPHPPGYLAVVISHKMDVPEMKIKLEHSPK